MGGQMEGDPSKIYVLVSSYSTSTRPEIVSILVDKYENKVTEALSAYGFRVYRNEEVAIKAAKLAGVIK
jgi:hypothetical protein